ncbi:MAG: 1-acyl-sn-glycerol-3-phosphate acyltransferase [Syntrophorhabdaceae bacterium]|nr:1-acyl-sn-glycerol-3-phosphate acyltransferase [Syntrophorhabdaceae bacterium]
MILRCAFQWIYLGFITLFFGPLFILLGLLARTRKRKGILFRRLSKWYCRCVMWMFRVKVEASGLSRIDPDKGYVFMSTHTGHLDTPALAIVLPQPLFWVFKKELAKIPIFGWALLAMGQIMIDRSDARQARESMNIAGEEMTGDMSVIIYPEGTRSKDGKLQPLKKGGFRIALGTGLPIVPVRVLGSHELLPAGAITVRPGRVVVELFDPIPMEGKTVADIPDLMEQVKAAFLS